MKALFPLLPAFLLAASMHLVAPGPVASGPQARNSFEEALFDRYFPRAEPKMLQPGKEESRDFSRYEGYYSSLRYSHSTLARMAKLVGTIRVSSNRQGLVAPGPTGSGDRWVEVEPGCFRDVTDRESLVFRRDGSGKATHMFRENVPVLAFEKLDWRDTPPFNWSLLSAAGILGLSALVVWPVGAFRTRRSGSGEVWPGLGTRLARPVAGLAWVLLTAFAAGLAYGLRDPMQLAFGVPAGWAGLLALPIAAAVLTPAAFVLAFPVRKDGAWSAAARVHYTLVVLALPPMCWFLHHWNLLGYHY